MSKYDPLYRHLSTQKGSSVQMSFAEIEALLGFELPSSAHKYAAWWANENPEAGQHTHSKAWMLADMQATANLTAELVVFEKLN